MGFKFNTLLRAILAGSGAAPVAPKTFFLNLSNASVGNIIDAQGVCTITDVGNLNPAISVNRSTGVAPLGVTFDASATQVDPAITTLPFHDLYYAWDFGDEVGATWGYGRASGTLSKNLAYGPTAAHVFETSGTKTVTLWTYYLKSDGSLVAKSTTTTITVTAADTVFAGKTFVCSTGTDFTGAPAGTQIPNATIANINTAIATAGGARVLLKRGDTWTPTTTSITVSNASPGILGAWGSGAAPKILMSLVGAGAVTGVNLSSSADWRVMDLEIASDTALAQYKYRFGIGVYGTNTTILRCNVHDCDYGVNAGASAGLYVVDSVFDTMFDAPVDDPTHGGPVMYIDLTDNVALMGNLLARSVGSHITRLQGVSYSVVANNTYIGASGFAHLGLTLRGKSNTGNVTVWSGTWSQNNVIADNYFDCSLGSQYTCHSGPQATSHAERVKDLIVERNHVISSNSTCMNFAVSYLTVRNNILNTQYSFALELSFNNGSIPGYPATSNNFVYNNTLVKRDTAISTAFSAASITGTGMSNLVFRNNLSYAPGCDKDGATNGTSPQFLTLGAGVTGADYTLGATNSTASQIKLTNPFGVSMPVTATQYAPAGYPVNAGEFVPVRADFLNTAITGTREIGALQA